MSDREMPATTAIGVVLFVIAVIFGLAALIEKYGNWDGSRVAAQAVSKQECKWRQLSVVAPYTWEWQLIREPDGMLLKTVRQEGVQLALYRVEGMHAFETLGGAMHEAEVWTNCEIKP